MACNCNSPCDCEELVIPLGPQGFPGEPGITPSLNFTVSTLAAGSQATVNQTGGPASYNVAIGIPRGDTGTGTAGTNGTDGGNAYTTLTAGFTQPALGSTVTLSVVTTDWMEPLQWIYIPGGGYYKIFSINSGTTVIVWNPGSVQGFPTGISTNAAVGATVGSNGVGVTPGGIPGDVGQVGPIGTPGDDGTDAELLVVYSNPVSAPAPGRSSVIVTDSATTPTFTVIQTWNGSAWAQTANIQGAAGTQITSTGGDPNATLPAGPIGTYAVRTDVPSIYVKTGASTWSFVVTLTPTFTQVATQSGGDFGTVPVSTRTVIGYAPLTDTHSAPGTYTFDLQYQSIEVDADKDIELDWDDTAYGDNAQWLFSITNTDGAPINITYATSQWSKDTGLTQPATLAASATQIYVCYRSGTRMLIANTFVVANI